MTRPSATRSWRRPRRGPAWQPTTRSASRAASASRCCWRSRGSATTEPVETILYGPVPDQEALHELLTRLQSLGLEVVEFRRLPGVEQPEGDADLVAGCPLRQPP